MNDICDRIIYLYNGRILNCSFENVLPGPWTGSGDGLYGTTLPDGQILYVSQPPASDSCAVISPEILDMTDRKPEHVEKLLRGVVTGIFFEKLLTGPRIHVVCGDHRFTVNVEEKDYSTGNIRPGKEVTLLSRPEDVTWLPE